MRKRPSKVQSSKSISGSVSKSVIMSQGVISISGAGRVTSYDTKEKSSRIDKDYRDDVSMDHSESRISISTRN